MTTPEQGTPEPPEADGTGSVQPDEAAAEPLPFGTPGRYTLPASYGPPSTVTPPPTASDEPGGAAGETGPGTAATGADAPGASAPPVPPGGFLPPAVAGTAGSSPYGGPAPATAAPAPAYGTAAPYGTAPAPYGTPASPYGTPSGPYGAPPASPYGPAGQPPRPGGRTAMAVTALVLAILGLLPSWIPFLQYVGGLFALVALVLGVVALVGAVRGTRQGRGTAVAAVAVSVVALLVVGVTHVAYAGIRSEFAEGFNRGLSGEDDPYTYPELTEETPEGPAADPVEVVEVVFGREPYDKTSWWYAAVIDNPNPEHEFPFAELELRALSADGEVLATETDYATLLPGRSAISGMLFELGATPVDSIEVVMTEDSEAEYSTELPTVEVSDVTAASDDYFTTVQGTVTVGGSGASSVYVQVVVLARDADGTAVGMANGYVDDDLSVGGTGEFEATFYEVMPEATEYEVYAMP